MTTNEAAVKALEGSGYALTSRNVVRFLVQEGYIEADPLSEPERFAKRAKDWVEKCGGGGSQDVFDKASGWNTDSWEIVMEDESINYPAKIKNIFAALCILAKEAGIKL